MILTFEGLDGAGKTTQARRLLKFLTERQTPALVERAQGGSVLSDIYEQHRKVDDVERLGSMSEYLLHLALIRDRHPNLTRYSARKPPVFIMDRFVESVVAYAPWERSAKEIRELRGISDLAFPDANDRVVIFLDLSPTQMVTRISNRGFTTQSDLRAISLAEIIRANYMKALDGTVALHISGELDELEASKRIFAFVETYL